MKKGDEEQKKKLNEMSNDQDRFKRELEKIRRLDSELA